MELRDWKRCKKSNIPKPTPPPPTPHLGVVSGIDGQRLGDDEQGVGEGLHAEPGPAAHLLSVFHEGGVRGHLERSGSGHHGAVVQRVLDGTQTVPDRVLGGGGGERDQSW